MIQQVEHFFNPLMCFKLSEFLRKEEFFLGRLRGTDVLALVMLFSLQFLLKPGATAHSFQIIVKTQRILSNWQQSIILLPSRSSLLSPPLFVQQTLMSLSCGKNDRDNNEVFYLQ